ncbi:nicotinic acid mononucleotide adenyltransferase [Maribacter sp. MJ134]|uniref:toxin-antitoxin system YwqK family antitoxin n=1 Tax=Maribacter sp. MJ134 TaxID=2496865 RepID=UPI000F8418C4|nr:nicotinic acid mononucleotide adenyltransferase [Maribacter sp. MJ134]AZQ59519.1 nicotinic acid mononucleotide adenyltransferase [Maribacter sp. MJ134]
MKKILIIALMSFSLGAFAQDIAPKFEKEGDMVKATYFHANGAVAQQGYFLNEKLEGEWTMFNEKGDKIAMGNYVKGAKTGKWLFWEGDALREVNFDNNKIAAVTNANQSRSLVKD